MRQRYIDTKPKGSNLMKPVRLERYERYDKYWSFGPC
ncbi:hypothetical protein FHS19_001265 [Paenibacillus rhizosphaerae]|uniref:Uncharacterized protein n=1 Tax=Paenibacillus rhizosphaerae TaxID=297318 RepID=A0A839TIW7_9BACL|nr:hypothetical protein [Paenibacillus rhizosphaerae]